MTRATVARASGSDRPPKYDRAVGRPRSARSAQVRLLLAEHPDLRATVIAERVGWTGSITWFRDNMRQLRAQYACPDRADRLEHPAGDVMQCDLWYAPVNVSTGKGLRRCFRC